MSYCIYLVHMTVIPVVSSYDSFRVTISHVSRPAVSHRRPGPRQLLHRVRGLRQYSRLLRSHCAV